MSATTRRLMKEVTLSILDDTGTPHPLAFMTLDHQFTNIPNPLQGGNSALPRHTLHLLFPWESDNRAQQLLLDVWLHHIDPTAQFVLDMGLIWQFRAVVEIPHLWAYQEYDNVLACAVTLRVVSPMTYHAPDPPCLI